MDAFGPPAEVLRRLVAGNGKTKTAQAKIPVKKKQAGDAKEI
jgi:hypothetical protein